MPLGPYWSSCSIEQSLPESWLCGYSYSYCMYTHWLVLTLPRDICYPLHNSCHRLGTHTDSVDLQNGVPWEETAHEGRGPRGHTLNKHTDLPTQVWGATITLWGLEKREGKGRGWCEEKIYCIMCMLFVCGTIWSTPDITNACTMYNVRVDVHWVHASFVLAHTVTSAVRIWLIHVGCLVVSKGV